MICFFSKHCQSERTHPFLIVLYFILAGMVHEASEHKQRIPAGCARQGPSNEIEIFPKFGWRVKPRLLLMAREGENMLTAELCAAGHFPEPSQPG